eukprot:scaffold94907_cov48-Phaeocystis_antarctica.AAC.1
MARRPRCSALAERRPAQPRRQRAFPAVSRHDLDLQRPVAPFFDVHNLLDGRRAISRRRACRAVCGNKQQQLRNRGAYSANSCRHTQPTLKRARRTKTWVSPSR